MTWEESAGVNYIYFMAPQYSIIMWVKKPISRHCMDNLDNRYKVRNSDGFYANSVILF